MLLDVSAPPIPLTPPATGPHAAVVDPVIEAMVNLMPDYSAGRRLHDLYVNKLQSALPGNYSQLFGTGPAFRTVFFPGWQPDPILGLAADTGLDDSWWNGFSVAVLCQAIAEMASEIRGQMLTDTINPAVSSLNATLRSRSARAYSKVLAATYAPFVDLLRQVDRSVAKERFHDSLLANVLNRQLWYQAGVWTSPDWEMFNQYAKYLALGASEAEVDTLIGELIAAGLPVPSQVRQDTWRSYADELRDKPDVDVSDIRTACANAVNAATYLPNFGGGPPSRMPNGNCFEFTANSQPGSKYRRAPGGSCFTADTQVLDRDGQPVELRELRRGDTVLTRDGIGDVGYVARSLRSGRALHRLGADGPTFTGAHPFLNAAEPDPAAPPPAVLALQPGVLASSVPTLSEDGIGILGPGSRLYSRPPGPTEDPVPVQVTCVEEVPAAKDDTYLYDVHLQPRAGRRQEFWAGCGDTFYLVSPEFPVLDQAGAAAITVVALMEGLLGTGGPDGDGWPGWVVDAVDQFGAGLFLGALTEALETTPSFGAPAPPAPLDQRIDRLYAALTPATPESAAIVSRLFDGLLSALGQWLSSLVALGWRTSTVLGGEVVAVTVFDLALTPGNPLPVDGTVRLDITTRGLRTSEHTSIWDRRGRANTRFHHFYDQLIHLDLGGEDRPTDLAFAASINGAAIPSLYADCPGVIGDTVHALQSAVLRDATGAVVGDIRFDTRRIGRDAASEELANSGLWTDSAAAAYANTLGVATVQPLLWKLRQLAPTNRR